MSAQEDLQKTLNVAQQHAGDGVEKVELQPFVIQELKAFSGLPRDLMVKVAGQSAGTLARKGIGPIEHQPHVITA